MHKYFPKLSKNKASSSGNQEAPRNQHPSEPQPDVLPNSTNEFAKVVDYEVLETDPAIRPPISSYHPDIQNENVACDLWNLGKKMEENNESETSNWPSSSLGIGDDNLNIPIDLFGSKKHAGVPHGILAFSDSSGNILFKVHRQPPNPNSKDIIKLLLDSSDTPLFSIHRYQKGLWKCYKGRGDGEKELVFTVQRKKLVARLNYFRMIELEVFLDGERLNDDVCDLKMRGSPFQKSCSIYKDDDLVAQTSLMYKLHQIYVSRSKFRLTIFPGTIDHALIVALFVIFLDGKK